MKSYWLGIKRLHDMVVPKFNWYKLGGSPERCMVCSADAWYFIQESGGGLECAYVCDIHTAYWLKYNGLSSWS